MKLLSVEETSTVCHLVPFNDFITYRCLFISEVPSRNQNIQFKSIPLSPSNAFSSLYDELDSNEAETIATESSQLNIFHKQESQLLAVVKPID